MTTAAPGTVQLPLDHMAMCCGTKIEPEECELSTVFMKGKGDVTVYRQ